MTLTELLDTMEPSQQDAVRATYFGGQTSSEAATDLAVDRTSLVAALAAAHGVIARWAVGGD